MKKKKYRIKKTPIIIISILLVFTAVFVYCFTRDTSLHVAPILQNPELPNGCEITSLAIVLQHMGFDISKEELADNYLEKQAFYTENGITYGGNPEEVFAGNPREPDGFYCFQQPIVKAANQY